jgi:hypothetical protein
VTTATQAATRYSGTLHGRADQVRRGRQAIAAYLTGCPVRDDATLIASELFGNAVLHSRSGRDGLVVLRCELNPGHVRLEVEVEDEGGPWRPRRRDDGRPHGLDVVAALAGPDSWGVQRTGDGSRIVWARLDLAAPGRGHMTHLPRPGDAERIADFLQRHLSWSAFWDKREGVWRVAEDDPDSDLYTTGKDADTVIGYMSARCGSQAGDQGEPPAGAGGPVAEEAVVACGAGGNVCDVDLGGGDAGFAEDEAVRGA